MGNSASSGRGHHEETVDLGYLTPQGIYTGTRDWNQSIVAQLICERKLAPFYRPLEDYDESWDDEQIFAHRREPLDADALQPEGSSSRADSMSVASRSSHHKRGHGTSNSRDLTRHLDIAVYRGAVECPICFLYYPPNINHSRCCDQAICTECFVQIKRAEPDPKHLVSEPASCPYCVQENFGVVYTPPTWRTGLGSEGATPPSWPESPKQSDTSTPMSAMKRPRKSFGADSPEVVTIDQIRPDWEAKLAAVRAAVARRANRRIIMRQVGDRLIPVGISSGRVHALPTEDGQIEGGEGGTERGSRRSRRRQQNQDINQLLGSMGLGGQDLEELMVMEALRLSLIEHEAQQRREREEEERKKAQSAAELDTNTQSQSQNLVSGTSSDSAPSSTSDTASALSTSAPVETSQIVEVTDPADVNTLTPTVAIHPLSSTPPTTESSSPSSDGAHPSVESDGGLSLDSATTSQPDGSSIGLSAVASRPETPVSAVDAPSNYDVLLSSPESAVSHKPLLRSRPPTPLADSGAASAN
ncbi:uncharacterized protein FIBRA_00955 [Fibroporia radiculosa]|uniref:RING-type domain-containing protein n=1 Tax=Fibroporia radiculosa TaxID=599839 RepID=J4HSI8_9APHY|nr:uncharacterized protein FIBRA_00955 [Fibroporia radiculosa]CCL98947.1 predicted protein [Fibroporia radiculosa]